MKPYSIEPTIRKHVKGYEFLWFRRNLSHKHGKQLWDTATKTVIDALQTACKKVVHKTAEATGNFFRN